MSHPKPKPTGAQAKPRTRPAPTPAPALPSDGRNTMRNHPPFLGFSVTVRDVVIERHEGIGLTLDEVLRRLLKGWPEGDPGDPHDEDLTVWEGIRVAAVLQADADGNPVVTRFDAPAAGPSAGAQAEAIAPTPDEPDAPAPATTTAREGARILAERRARLRTRGPLFRGVLTFADPGEPDFMTQLELIVTSESMEDSPSFYDLPQSKEAGWISHAHGTMNIAVRTIS